MHILKWTGVTLFGLAAAYAAANAIGAARWQTITRDLVAQLDAGRTAPAISRYHEADLAPLPAPVQRYFRAVLTDGQPIITQAVVTQKGVFNMSTTPTAQWKAFTATQTVSTNRPGFVWDARIMLFPGVPVRVVDAYVAGNDTLRPSILGLYPMADMHGTGEIARGELMRWFSETIWYPTALLPSQGVVWQAVDDVSAQATVTDGPITLTLLFRFGADGLISTIHADARAKMSGTTVVMAPWDCTMSDYRKQDGMLVPFTGTVGYVTDTGVQDYFRATLQSVAYAFTD